MSGHSCPQCHTPAQVQFYCVDCLSARIQAHHDDIARVQAAKDTVQAQVEQILGTLEVSAPTGRCAGSSHSDLPDPFGEPDPELEKQALLADGAFSGATHVERRRRAERAALSYKVAQQRDALLQSRSTLDAEAAALQERRSLLARRRQNLRCAQLAGLAGVEPQREPALSSSVKARNRSVLSAIIGSPFANPREEQEGEDDEEIEAIRGVGLAEELRVLKEDVRSTEARALLVSSELARIRAILAREAFSVFDVRPPPGSIANMPKGSGALTSTPSPSREARSRDRYSLGSLSFMSGSTSRGGREEKPRTDAAANASNWTINGFVLPAPTDLRRFQRDDINAAVTLTMHLVQLLCAYLGIELPFVLVNSCGALHVRPSSLWPGVRASKQALSLSNEAYTSLVSLSSPSGLAASTIGGLGASTLSTLESFVQLPGGNHFSWGLTSMLGSDKQQGEADPSKGGVSSSEDTAASQALRSFCTALTMLSYDIAYLCSLQGLHVELLSAAAPPLRLLSRIMSSPDLGKRAHANSSVHKEAHVKDLAFDVEWGQWEQVHEMPGVKAGDAASAKGSVKTLQSLGVEGKSPATPSGSRGKEKTSAAPPIRKERRIDESYIDAEEIVKGMKFEEELAASKARKVEVGAKFAPLTSAELRSTTSSSALLESRPKQPERVRSSTRRESSSATARGRTAPVPGLASSRIVPSAPVPPSTTSLDFLRKRAKGADLPSALASTSLSAQKTTSGKGAPARATHTAGAVIFNGVEIGARDSANAGAPAAAATRKMERDRLRGKSNSGKNRVEESWDVL